MPVAKVRTAKVNRLPLADLVAGLPLTAQFSDEFSRVFRDFSGSSRGPKNEGNGGKTSGIPRDGSEDSSGKDLPRFWGKSGGFQAGIRDLKSRISQSGST